MSDQSGASRGGNPADRPKSRNYAYLLRTLDFMRPYVGQLACFLIALMVTSGATLSMGFGLKFLIGSRSGRP